MRRAILIQCDDWEGLFVDGILVDEDHKLDNPLSWIKWTRAYDLHLGNFQMVICPEDLEQEVCSLGGFPNNSLEYLT